MADEFQLGSGNWWESTRSSTTSTTNAGTSSSRRFETSTAGSSPPSSTPMNSSSTSNNFGWPTSQIMETPRPTSNNSNDSSSATAAATSLLFQTDHTHMTKHLQQQQQQQPQQQQQHHHHLPHPPRHHAPATSLLISDPNLHMMGLGLSSQHTMDHWDQPNLSFRSSEKGDENSFRTMLQEDNLSSNTTSSFQQAEPWPSSLSHSKMLMYNSSGTNSDQDSIRAGGGGGFSLDQSQLISNTALSNQHHEHHNLSQSTEDSTISFHQMDSSSSSVHHYQNNPSSTNLQPGILGYEMSQQQQIINSSPSNFDSTRPASMHTTNYNSYPSSYGININSSSKPVDQQQQQQQQAAAVTFQQPNSNAWSSLSTSKPQTQLHFSNNAPFWNASNTPAVLPSLQMQSPSSTIDEKPKKSSSSEASTKRPRNEPSSALPAFKVRKEKMGDRITALQQLVSPFGKTDTASVLSEAIEYIKFLHQQVSVLSDPYMKSGAPIEKQKQGSDHKSKDQEGEKQDLRSRGLCLVPVSSTFPVTHETTVDFWNPTFGGTFR